MLGRYEHECEVGFNSRENIIENEKFSLRIQKYIREESSE